MDDLSTLQLIVDGVVIRENVLVDLDRIDGRYVINLRPFLDNGDQCASLNAIRDTLGVVLKNPHLTTTGKMFKRMTERISALRALYGNYTIEVVTRNTAAKKEWVPTRLGGSADGKTSFGLAHMHVSESGRAHSPADAAPDGSIMQRAQEFMERATRALFYRGRLPSHYGPLRLEELCVLLGTTVRMCASSTLPYWNLGFAEKLFDTLAAAACAIIDCVLAADADATRRFVYDANVMAVNIPRMYALKQVCLVLVSLRRACTAVMQKRGEKLPRKFKDKAIGKFDTMVAQANGLVVFLYARALDVEKGPWAVTESDADARAIAADDTCPLNTIFSEMGHRAAGDGWLRAPYCLLDSGFMQYLYGKRTLDTCDVCGGRATCSCSGCERAAYCSDACATFVWQKHKRTCLRANYVSALSEETPLDNCRVCGTKTKMRCVAHPALVYCGFACYAADGEMMKRHAKARKAEAKAKSKKKTRKAKESAATTSSRTASGEGGSC